MKASVFCPREALFLAALACGTIFALLATANAQTPAGAQNGKKVFQKQGCSRCHGAAGEGMPGNGSGPPKIAATPLAPLEFIGSVRDPKGLMPSFAAQQVSDVELADVYAFLQAVATQPKVDFPSSANAENGKRFYTSFGCYECHGLQGQGSSQTGGARLGPPQIPFSGFVSYARQPTGQMPPYAAKAISDAQLADIYAFLRSLPEATPAKDIPLLNQ